jgi:hypothetical protein
MDEDFYSQERIIDQTNGKIHCIRHGDKAKKWDIKNNNSQDYLIASRFS